MLKDEIKKNQLEKAKKNDSSQPVKPMTWVMR